MENTCTMKWSKGHKYFIKINNWRVFSYKDIPQSPNSYLKIFIVY